MAESVLYIVLQAEACSSILERLRELCILRPAYDKLQGSCAMFEVVRLVMQHELIMLCSDHDCFIPAIWKQQYSGSHDLTLSHL